MQRKKGRVKDRFRSGKYLYYFGIVPSKIAILIGDKSMLRSRKSLHLFVFEGSLS